MTVVWGIHDGLSPILRKVARSAEVTLAEDGYPAEWCWLLSRGHFFKGISTDLRQAADYLTRIRIIRNHIERGNAREAADAVEALYIKIHRDRFARAAAIGQKQIDSMRAVGLANKIPQYLLDDWQDNANDVWAKHPEWSKSNVAEQIKKDTSTSYPIDTIRKHIHKPKLR